MTTKLLSLFATLTIFLSLTMGASYSETAPPQTITVEQTTADESIPPIETVEPTFQPFNETTGDNLTIDIVTVGDYKAIQITNPTDRAISTKGLYLSNEHEEPFLWQIPSVVIRSGDYAIFKSFRSCPNR